MSTLAFRKQLAGELTKLRTRGLNSPRLNNLDGLLKVAKVLTTEGTEVERIEAVLETAIEGYGRDSKDYHVARLWFGLDAATRKLSVTDRHEAAWKRYGGKSEVAEGTFTSHTWQKEFRDVLARWLAERYAEQLVTPKSHVIAPTDTPQSETQDDHNQIVKESPALPKHRRLRVWFGKTQRHIRIVIALILCIAGMASWLFLSNHSSRPRPRISTTARKSSYSLTGPADMPEIVRGSGTEKMHASGYYGTRPFVARGGVVVFQNAEDEFEIILFPEPVSCALWYRGTPAGIEFDIDVYANAQSLQAIPVGRPLNEYWLNWAVHHGNVTNLDIAATRMDGLSEPGLVILTAIETAPGGFWRGRVKTQRSKTAGDVEQKFSGTFAAQWCNISTGPS